MIRVFISVPMSGKSEFEIRRDIDKVSQNVLSRHLFGDEEIEFVHNLLTKTEIELFDLLEKPVIENLLYLGTAITKMASCNAVVFAPGWDNARGCRVEFEVAKEYGLPKYFA